MAGIPFLNKRVEPYSPNDPENEKKKKKKKKKKILYCISMYGEHGGLL